MGTNLLGRGALVTLDAGLCDLAVSQKSVGRCVRKACSGRSAYRSHPPPALASWKRWTGIPKGIESACQFGVRRDGSGRDNGACDL